MVLLAVGGETGGSVVELFVVAVLFVVVVLLFVRSSGDKVCSNNIFRVFFAEISPHSRLQFFEFLLLALNVFSHVGHVLIIIDSPNLI